MHVLIYCTILLILSFILHVFLFLFFFYCSTSTYFISRKSDFVFQSYFLFLPTDLRLLLHYYVEHCRLTWTGRRGEVAWFLRRGVLRRAPPRAAPPPPVPPFPSSRRRSAPGRTPGPAGRRTRTGEPSCPANNILNFNPRIQITGQFNIQRIKKKKCTSCVLYQFKIIHVLICHPKIWNGYVIDERSYKRILVLYTHFFSGVYI